MVSRSSIPFSMKVSTYLLKLRLKRNSSTSLYYPDCDLSAFSKLLDTRSILLEGGRGALVAVVVKPFEFMVLF